MHEMKTFAAARLAKRIVWPNHTVSKKETVTAEQ